ncbi:hypothetical protein VaNZ11_011086 [Volvox africanus]|uniref:Uncharacterized protein n=1 Tax=Volvox africanus TaxID=51714 RepID=A0ABQ5SAR2_9CHLO|nr:hypothetical protein VaNZ11_011086 [Volvox africanus]
MALKPGPSVPIDPETCRDGRDLENGRDLEVQPLVQHFSYDPNSRWHRLKQAIIEPPKSTVSIYADIPFNHAEWKRHRNAAWRHRPQPILFMRVAGGFWWQLTYTFIVSLCVGIYHHRVKDVTAASSKLSVPFNLTTFALSLLLVFRTNSSYSRWWEARTVWGAVVNLSRNFARQSMLWLPPKLARVAVRWMMAAPYLLKCHLRFNASVRENVSHILMPKELDWVLGWTHRPNAAAHVLATAVTEGRLDTNREKLLMELVDTFIDCVGKCERIFKTPIPAAYTRHTSRYLMIYLTACPLVLWPSLGWWTLIAAVLIAFLLLGTENIGVQIEEPFRVLPLDDMCRGIEATLREMERQHSRLGQQFNSWAGDPAALSRTSSESSLDSFIDGPADGPSEPAALDRFHNIPPPARLAAAAQALLLRRPSLQSGAGTVTGSPSAAAAAAAVTSGSVDISGRFTTANSGELLAMQHQQHYLFPSGTPPPHGLGAGGGAGSNLISGLLHHVMHSLGGSGGGSASSGGAGAGAAAPSPNILRNRSGSAPAAAAVSFSDSAELNPEYIGSGDGAANHSHNHMRFPHHVHHRHRNLPQHPADVPSTALAVGTVVCTGPVVLSPSGSSRFARVSFERAAPRLSVDEGRVATATTPFARCSQQRQGELGQRHECREPPPAPSPSALRQEQQQPEQMNEGGVQDGAVHGRTSGGSGGENGKSGDGDGIVNGSGSAAVAQGDVVSERER